MLGSGGALAETGPMNGFINKDDWQELWRPWKGLSFGTGMAWLIHGALVYDFADWDIGISLLMGTLTYVFAPWSIRTLWLCLRTRPPRWLWRVLAALTAAWFAVDGVYVAYNVALHHPFLRYENFCASSLLYFLAGMIWLYRGSLREMKNDLLASLSKNIPNNMQ